MNSRKRKIIDITDYYSIRVKSIWNGLKEESAAYWFLCIYIFFEYVRPQSIYTAIDVLPWPQIALILAVGTTYIDKSLAWTRNRENVYFLFFQFLVLVSSLFAFRPEISWANFVLVVNWLVVYFLIITVVNTEKRFLVFLLLFLLVSFKMSQHGFRSFAGRGFSFASYGVSGSPGWFRNSGEFGIQMTIFVPLSIAFILVLKNYWGRLKRIFFYMMPITGMISIAASSSRGAQLAIACVGVWFLLKSRMGIKALIWIAVLGWALYMVIPAEQLQRFSEMGEDKSSIQRLEYWKFAVDVVKEHPMLGIGYANWYNYCWFMNPQGLGINQTCERLHNTYLQAAAEMGILGFIAYALMVIYVFVMNARTRKFAASVGNRFIIYIAHGLDGGLIGYMVSSFFISTLFYPFFWVQMAMSVALHQVAKQVAGVKTRPVFARQATE